MKTFVSLFSGCGGLDLGFHHAGFVGLGAFEINTAASAVFRSNLNFPCINHDLSTGDLPLKFDKPVDIVVAGPPCQGFSTAGKRLLHDPRNPLLIRAGEIAIKLQPSVIVIENVAGVKSGEHYEYWKRLIAVVSSAGYSVAELKCDCSLMGVPQKRVRMILLAWNNKKEFQTVLPVLPKTGLETALRNLNEAINHDKIYLEKDSDILTIAQAIKPGQKLSNVRGGVNSVHTWDIPKVFGSVTAPEREVLECLLKYRRKFRCREHGDGDPVPLPILVERFGYNVEGILNGLYTKNYIKKINNSIDLTQTFNGKYRRLSWDKPAPTVDTRFGNPRYFLHPEEDRGFTVREAARIQGFPDDYVFSGAQAEQFRMIGNAVPPPVASVLGSFIQKAVFN